MKRRHLELLKLPEHERQRLQEENIKSSKLKSLCEKYVEWMRLTNFSETTVSAKSETLNEFFKWCEERSVDELLQVNRRLLERYQKNLYNYRNEKTGKPLAMATQAGRLCTVRSFFKWLTRKGFISVSPAADLDLPRVPKRLPKYVLTLTEVEKVLAQVDLTHPTGLRDRAILEVFYSTGIRRCELMRLKLNDIDQERGLINVKLGKGGRDRVIPIGERAMLWLRCYVERDRAVAVREREDAGIIFLNLQGKPLALGGLTQLAHKYIKSADIGKTGACHIFRHTMATLMLENETDIRFIQAILGHRSLATTDIYTHVGIKKLKEVHSNKHPGAVIKPLIKP